MKLTRDQQQALNMFTSGENMLLLGDPGTGKSTLIQAITNQAAASGLTVARTASTGIAAQLIGGRTIHSFLKAYPGMDQFMVNYETKVQNLNETNVLIVDEISMLGSSFMGYLSKCITHAQHHVQIIFVGDFFQLPPVKDSYAFHAPCWPQFHLQPCFLTQVIRQNDAEFVRSINMLKYADTRCLPYLLSHSSPVLLENQITICARRKEAAIINDRALNHLHGTPQMYTAEYEGTINTTDLLAEECLILKQGMRVMAITNGNGYSNGSLGTVTDMDASSVEVLFDNQYSCVFEKTCFKVDRKDIVGTTTDFWQIPLRPAYAITIHKSQGQTFQYVNIDGSKCWAPGQLYVAVSRARSIQGIHFLTPIQKGNIKTDPAVRQFYNRVWNMHQQIQAS